MPKNVAFLRLLLALTLLGAWQFASGRLIEPIFLSSPVLVAVRLVELFATGEIFVHLRATVTAVVYGYVTGALVGIGLGFATGRSPTLSQTLEPFLMAFYSIPKMALAPLFVIWLGIGLASKVAIVFISVFFLTFFNTYAGVKTVSEDYINLARIMRASQLTILGKVILPAAMPSIILGLKMGLPYGIIGAFVAEFIASNKGIGYFILYSSSVFDSTGVFAGVFTLLGLVVLANWGLGCLEARLVRWRPVQETGIVI
jgi:NitT/TauT family transport system permease protein